MSADGVASGEPRQHVGADRRAVSLEFASCGAERDQCDLQFAAIVQAQAQTNPPANQGREAVIINGIVTPERITETLENQAKRRQEAGGAPFVRNSQFFIWRMKFCLFLSKLNL